MKNFLKISLVFLISFMILNVFSDDITATLSMENDSFISAGDNDYTHGTCLELADGMWKYKLGQNMYAPADLTKKEHIKGDRPYAGLIYGGVGAEFFANERIEKFLRRKVGFNDKDRVSFTHYAELDGGMIGPAAGCKATQKFVHKVLGCKDPKGWGNQLHNEPILNAQWWTKMNWYPVDWFAIVPRSGVLAGNLQDAVEVGIDFKLGWNLQDDVGNQILLSATPQEKGGFWDKLSAWAFVGCDERYYLYNHILEGSMFNHRDDHLSVDIEPFVFEWRCGIAMKYGNFHACYYAVFREKEFKHQKTRPDYGGISIGWTF